MFTGVRAPYTSILISLSSYIIETQYPLKAISPFPLPSASTRQAHNTYIQAKFTHTK